MDAYHAEKNVLTKSGTDRLSKSPAKYRAWRDGEIDDKETDALIDGRLLHMATLEPNKFKSKYFGLVEPEWGNLCATKTTTKEQAKENKTRRDEWRSEHPDWNSLNNLGEKYDYYIRLAERVRRHPLAARILASGESEIEYRRELETVDGDNVMCKCRYDWICEDFGTPDGKKISVAADLKFVREDYADPRTDKFWYMVRDHRYHVQQAFYGKIHPVDMFYFVVVEKSYPHDMAVYRLPLNLELEGDQMVDEDLQTYADCKKSGKWPGYPVVVNELMEPRDRKQKQMIEKREK